jgi:uncharacterized membrane protein YuzA (DUF378 family)
MTFLDKVTGFILVATGIVLGIVGFFNYNVFEKIFIGFSSLIYKIIGVSALYFIHRIYRGFK